jgi:VIT1/CCC1 family predicted Fe2+/Mn2+ transporter
MNEKTKKWLLQAQKSEITEYHIYSRLAKSIKNEHNRNILNRIAGEEKKHHDIWEKYTQKKVSPSWFKVWAYFIISKLLGLTFGIKLMERGEDKAQVNYEKISKEVPDAKQIKHDENEHEKELINLIDEERLQYVGSIVLGLNDALVELTGALAGLTFALQNPPIIAMAGFITGISASFSMAASEYLSKKSGESEANPVKSSIYTGVAYILTVFFLIFPYLILANVYISLGWMLVNAILVILVFNFYISVAKELKFGSRFWEMTFISLGVAAFSFGVGVLLRTFFHIDV